MIVVEGPDGSGKSTLIAHIRNKINLPVAERVVSQQATALTDLSKWVDDNLAAGWQDMIFDRHRLISEPIYGSILRPKITKGFDDPGWFFPRLQRFYQIRPLIIYCLPPVYQVWKNVRNDPDNEVVASQDTTQAIWGAYFNKAMTDMVHRPSVVMYDYTDLDLRNLQFNSIIRSIQERRL